MKALSLDRQETSNYLMYAADEYRDNGEKDGEYLHMKNTLRAILSSDILTDRQRDTLILRYVDGLTLDEIAIKMGITSPTVCKHIQKARRAVDTIMKLAYPRLKDADIESEKWKRPRAARSLGKKDQFTFLGMATGARA